MWLHFNRKKVAKGREIEKIKIIIRFCSNLTRNRKFQKNSKKFKKLKNTIMASFRTKIGWKWMRNTEKKRILVPFRSYLTRKIKFQKNSKKIVKIKKYH